MAIPNNSWIIASNVDVPVPMVRGMLDSKLCPDSFGMKRTVAWIDVAKNATRRVVLFNFPLDGTCSPPALVKAPINRVAGDVRPCVWHTRCVGLNHGLLGDILGSIEGAGVAEAMVAPL